MATNASTVANAAPDEVFGWVWEPDGRGTFDILKSCVITMALCVYTALHLNLPADGASSLSLHLRKTKWVMFGIFAPEIIVYIAWRQRMMAKSLTKDLTLAFEEQAKADPTTKRKYKWTETHSWFALMGGFAMDTSDHDHDIPGEFVYGSPRIFLSANGAKVLGQLGLLPDISQQFIKDKSKADSLAKVLVIFQAGWMISQCIMRFAYHLPITNLELTTLAHALSALMIYVFWWEKPLDIQEPTVMKGSWVPSFAATLMVFGDIRSTGRRREAGATWRKVMFWTRDLLLHWFDNNRSESHYLDWMPLNQARHTLSCHEYKDAKTGIPAEKVFDSVLTSSCLALVLSPLRGPHQVFWAHDLSKLTKPELEEPNTTVRMYDYEKECRKVLCIFSGIAVLSELWSDRSTMTNPYDCISVVDIRRWQLFRRCIMENTQLRSCLLKEREKMVLDSSTSQASRDACCAIFTALHFDVDDKRSYFRFRVLSDWGALGIRSKFKPWSICTSVQPSNWVRLDGWYSALGFCLPVIAYGSIHAKGWESTFPTEMERLLWKVSCISVPASGLLLISVWAWYAYRRWLRSNPPGMTKKALLLQKVLRKVDGIMRKGVNLNLLCLRLVTCGRVTRRRIFAERQLDKFSEAIGWFILGGQGVTISLVCGFVLLCRGFLVVESFVGLRSLPAKTFKTPEWTDYIPHM